MFRSCFVISFLFFLIFAFVFTINLTTFWMTYWIKEGGQVISSHVLGLQYIGINALRNKKALRCKYAMPDAHILYITTIVFA